MEQLKIVAFNINTGGAKILLNVLINKLIESKTNSLIIISDKTVIDNSENLPDYVIIQIVRNYLLGILNLFKKQTNILFFGNLPPFRKCKNSILYIHNPYYVLTLKEVFYESMPLKSKFKYLMQIIIVYIFNKNTTHIAVQTEFMARLLKSKLKREAIILPFFEEKLCKDDSSKKIYDFCYVGLPSKHKNHESLLAAIHKLVQMNIRFSIALTVPNFKENNFLISEIETINKILPGCIENFGMADKLTVHEIYSKSRALVFPSKKESLGLPIIEALQHNLKILSSNLGFSHEIIKNPITFEPDDSVQIENVMKDFLDGKFNSIQQSLKIKSHLDTIVELIS